MLSTERCSPVQGFRRLRVVCGLALCVVGLLAGCGGDSPALHATLYPVKGQVLLANGKPLTGGKVIFLPTSDTAQPATGKIGSDGTFALTSADAREGAAEGEYKVRIEPDPALAS